MSIADLDVQESLDMFSRKTESCTAEELEYFEQNGDPGSISDPYTLEWLLRIAGPYFYTEGGDRRLPDDDELFDRLDRFGRCIHKLTSPTRQEHATQIWIDYLKTSLGDLVPAPWRTVKTSIEAGKAGEQAGTSVGFKWLDDTELEKLPAAEDLVSGHIPEGSLTVIYGPPGSAKTFLALDVALCIGTGQPWFGNDVQQGRVAFIVAEGKTGIAKRVRAWKSAYLSPDEPANVRFLPQPIEFINPDSVDRLIADLRTWDPAPKVVFFDTLAQCLVGGDENSPKDMGLAIHAINRLRQEFNCAVIVIHHTGWNASHERGHTSLRGASDVTIRVECEGDEVVVTCEKAKESEPFDRLRLQLKPTEDSCVLTRYIVRPDQLSPSALTALQALADVALEDGATATQWLEAATQPSDLLSKSGESKPSQLSKGTYWRVRKTLTDHGYVQLDGNRYHVTSKGDDTLNSH